MLHLHLQDDYAEHAAAIISYVHANVIIKVNYVK